MRILEDIRTVPEDFFRSKWKKKCYKTGSGTFKPGPIRKKFFNSYKDLK
jgi:hypothetical protein